MSNKNKSVIIIGGLGLIGKSISYELLKNNFNVTVADISKNKINRNKDKNFLYVRTNLTSKSSLDNLIKRSEGKFGKIDAIINCSFPRNNAYGKKALNIKFSDFSENLKLHLGGFFLVNQIFCKYFLKNNGGNIINFGSIYGSTSPKFDIYKNTKIVNSVEYAAIKAGILHMNIFFANLFKKKKIRLNTISPGGIKNKHSERFMKNYKKYSGSKGMLNPEDILGLILFLLSDSSNNITGQDFIIDDGFSL